MGRVGTRELRQSASELVRRVEAGETIEITDRGRPVAVLAPLPTGSPLERLRASGDLERASDELADLPPPLELEQGSTVLSRLRVASPR